MPDSTPILGLPYPLPADAVTDYPTTGRELAELLEELLGLRSAIDAGSALIIWPGGGTQSNVTHVAHGLGVVPAAVHITMLGLSTGGPLPVFVAMNADAAGFDVIAFANAAVAANGNSAVWWTAIGPTALTASRETRPVPDTELG